jgi:hypothetical protein
LLASPSARGPLTGLLLALLTRSTASIRKANHFEIQVKYNIDFDRYNIE